MDYYNPYIELLTFRECLRWVDRDPEEYNNWISRTNKVDTYELKTGKRVPRHRYNEDPAEP